MTTDFTPSTTVPKLLLSAREAARALSICEKSLWAHTAIRGLERVEAIRRRQRIPSPMGVAEMLIDLNKLTDT